MSEMIYGIHAVQALLERAPERFQEVFILKGREDKRLLPLIHALESQGVVIQLANRQYLDEKSDGAVHQGIIARVKPGRQYQENDLPDLIASLNQPFLLILDGVTDPHNLGACLRSADAAGVHAVIVPKDRSAQLNATAIQVGHDFGQSLGDAFVEADGFTGGFEHRAVLDAVNDFRRVRAEAEVDYFHQLTLLAWCTKRFVSIRANAVPVLHRQGDSPTTARKWGLTKNVPD